MGGGQAMNPTADEPIAVLFVQGAGEHAHDADSALAEDLARALGDRFEVVFPRLPREANPDTAAWNRTIAAEARRARAAVVVAHSAGATNVAEMLAEGRRGELPDARAMFLLAPPFIGPGGWAFEGFHLDHATSRQALGGLPLHFYFGAEDQTVPLAHATLYEGVFPDARFHRLEHCDHQFDGHLQRVAQDIRSAVGASS
jgi:predicted alpha/beta hydrolase family esterase